MERSFSLANSVWQLFLSLPPITQWAVTMLIVCAILAYLFTYNEHTVHEGPSIFTTAGIFFTFLGIAEGLYEFNPQKIDASIPALLDGLKTAFIASVVGVGAALSIKLRYAVLGVKRTNRSAPSEGATVDDLYNQLVGVQQSLVGDDESTLISQLKLSRQDTNDRLEALSQSQNAFMQKLAEGNSKALIIALQEVIRDFNTKITDQFGDNFKQLNQAVGAMLDWQKQYREQIGEMIEQQSRAAENMDIASPSYS
jgi:urea transporter